MPFLDGTGLQHLKVLIKQQFAARNSDGAVLSTGADYAEYATWNDGNVNGEDRRGYFVTVVNGTNEIAKANSDSAIVGVTTNSAAFIGNYTEGAETENSKGLIGIVGQINVIDNGRCAVGSRCMPDNDGTAKPSDNSCGYKVIERVDDARVRIMVSPTIDMIQRIKTDITEIESIFAGGLSVADGGTGANNIVDANVNLGIGGKLLWYGSKNSTGSITITNVHKYQIIGIRTADAFYGWSHIRNNILNIRGAIKSSDNMIDTSLSGVAIRAEISNNTVNITNNLLHNQGNGSNRGNEITEIWGFGRITE